MFSWLNDFLSFGSGNNVNSLNIGEIIAYSSLVKLINSNVIKTMSVVNNLKLSFISSVRLFDFLEKKITKKNKNKNELTLHDNSNICFNHVSFSYAAGIPVLKDVTFNINGGTKNAIVGSFNSGKTTIVNLLARFFEFNNGVIYVDGRNITEYTCNEIRKNIIFLSRNAILFPSTIKDNIWFKEEKFIEKEFSAAVKKANASDFINNLSSGKNTTINPESVEFSEEEKQLIVIARAFLSDAKILIVDETTPWNNSDPRVKDALERLAQDRTTIFITNCLETTKKVDKILVLRKGEIVEEGNHTELMTKNNFYASFVQTWKKFN